MTDPALALLADQLDPEPSPFAGDPVGWVREVLGEHMWSRQREIAESVRDHRYTAVPSCHAAGKSYTASRLVAWWLESHRPGEAFVVSTAPTFPQVRAILWREIGRAHAKGRLRGRVNQTEWWIGPEIVAYGRKPSDYDPSAFQGIHAPAVLVVIDEACGVPRPLWDAVDSLVTNDRSRVLAIGNPDDPGAHFASVCKPGSGWRVLPISAFDTPAFSGEAVPEGLLADLVSPTWVDERRERWGEGTPLWDAKVLGRFPEDSDDGVVPLSWIRRCQAERRWNPADLAPVELGVDVGGGGDESVIRERRGVVAGRVWRSRHTDAMRLVGEIVQAIDESGARVVKIDVIGIGWGVAGRLEEVMRERVRGGGHSAKVVRVNVGRAPRQPRRFAKLRDEIWWEVGRELSQNGAWDLAGVDDDTVAQLIAPRYEIDSSGRVRVEPKDETRRRLGRSPDDADALLLAFYGRGQDRAPRDDDSDRRDRARPETAGMLGRSW